MAGARPRYVAFEGTEGSGKSTHAARFAAATGALLTRETGGTDIGRRLRDILHDTSVTGLDDRAEALLIAADRAQHLAEIVRPALASGRSVVTDRSVFSTLAYQGYGRGLDVDELRRLNDWALGGRWPDVVVLVDAPADVLAARLAKRDLDRFERAGDEFHERVIDGFRQLASADPDHWIIVRADGEKDAVAAEILAAVETTTARLGPDPSSDSNGRP